MGAETLDCISEPIRSLVVRWSPITELSIITADYLEHYRREMKVQRVEGMVRAKMYNNTQPKWPQFRSHAKPRLEKLAKPRNP